MIPEGILVQFFLSFLAVTSDEFVVLILFFSRSFRQDERLLSIQVFVGHIVGFSLVVALSLAIGCAGLVLPLKYLSYLGLIPLYLGLYDLAKRIPRYCNRFRSKPQHQQQTVAFRDDSSDDEEENNPEKFPNKTIELLTHTHGTIEDLPLLQSSMNLPAAYDSIPTDVTENRKLAQSLTNVSTSGGTPVDMAQHTKTCWSPHIWGRLAITDPDIMYIVGAALAEASEEIAVFAPLFTLLFKSPVQESVNNAEKSNSHTLKNGNLSWQSLSTLLTMICWLYLLLVVELCLAYAIALYLSGTAATSTAAPTNKEHSHPPPETYLKWVWERVVQLGMPVVLIVVGVTVLLGLWQDDL